MRRFYQIQAAWIILRGEFDSAGRYALGGLGIEEFLKATYGYLEPIVGAKWQKDLYRQLASPKFSLTDRSWWSFSLYLYKRYHYSSKDGRPITAAALRQMLSPSGLAKASLPISVTHDFLFGAEYIPSSPRTTE